MTHTVVEREAIASAPVVARRGRLISGMTAAAVLCFAAVVVACFGFYWGGWPAAPISIRFIVGVFVFGICPGVLIVGPFLSARRYRLDASDIAISVITCSFSCNLALNVVLFALQWSMTRLTRAYIVAQAAGYVLWGVWALARRNARRPDDREPSVGTSGVNAGWWLLLAATSAVVYIMYTHGAPITNSEELVWLRKLVENRSVRFDNLSYRRGDPSTYLFVPFQIFIAGTSIVAHMDVALTYSLFWAVTTALSIFVISRLAYVLFGRAEVAALACLWMVAIAAFEPDSMIYGAGLVVPFPNRYGFAGGVLLPLTLLLFWSVLRDPEFHLWRWALLVYVAVEMTFVHARETLLGIGTMAAVFAMLAVRPARNRQHILRVASLVAITGLVLVVYKRTNLARAPDLDAYVAAMTRACHTALIQLISDHSPLDLLTIGVPDFMNVSVDGSTPIVLQLSTFRVMFIETWGYKLLARLFLPLALLSLPFYALRARSIAELSLVAALAALGVITSSLFLTLVVLAVVGSPEVLILYNVISLFSLLVVCGLAWNLGLFIARWCPRSNFRVGLTGTLKDGTTRDFSVVLAPAYLAAIPFLLLVAWSYASADTIIGYVASLSSKWAGPLGPIMLAATVLAVVYRVRRRDLPLFSPIEKSWGIAAFTATCLIVALLIPAIRRSGVWETNPFTPRYPSHRFTGNLYHDYQMTIAPESKKLDYTIYLTR